MAIAISDLTEAAAVNTADTAVIVQGGSTLKAPFSIPWNFGGAVTVGGALTVSGKLFVTNDTASDSTALVMVGGGGELSTPRSAIAIRNAGFTVPSNTAALSNGDKLVLWNAGAIKLAIGLDSGGMWFQGNGSSAQTGFVFYGGSSATPAKVFHIVTPVASAVNYVSMQPRETLNRPVIGFNGSDTDISGAIVSKGGGFIDFYTGGVFDANGLATAAVQQFRVAHTADAVNLLSAAGGAAGSSPGLTVFGNDTDIDLGLVTKGAGVVRFGTHSAIGAESVTGYITIKDSGGTLRKVAVVS